MNYYNPYFYTAPQALTTTRVGLLSRLFGRTGVTLSGIINGTQRVLSFANQAIPFVKQVRPMIGNAKTMFKVMNEFKKSERSKNSESAITTNTNHINKNNAINKESNKPLETNYTTNEGPTFFM